MKNVVLAFAALMFFAATAQAAEKAISAPTLKSMGLAGMQEMSDSDGLSVRGKALNFGSFGGFGGLGGFGGSSFPSSSFSPFTSAFGSIAGAIFANINGQLPAGVTIPFPTF